MTTINPYLAFDGNCEEAFNFYKSVFGGDFMTVMRFKDVPAEYEMAESEGEKVMHIALPIGQGTILMGSDTPAQMGPLTSGDNYSIAISAEPLGQNGLQEAVVRGQPTGRHQRSTVRGRSPNNDRASQKTSSSIAAVSRPVWVFCRLG